MTEDSDLLSTKKDCVLCGSRDLELLISFPKTPIANHFILAPNRNPKSKLFPLDLGICNECKHIQLLTIIPSTLLFQNYPYISVTNSEASNRLEALSGELNDIYPELNNKFVVEIGSNDGFLLQNMKNLGWRALGIDPARNIAEIANAKGIETIIDFFSEDVAIQILDNYSQADLIIANNVLAHSNSLNDIFKGINLLMHPGSTLVMEFSYVVDIFEKLLFDTIYHEHTSYHSVTSLIPFLAKCGLVIVKAIRINAHGGSLRLYIKKQELNLNIDKSVENLLIHENEMNLNKLSAWENFNLRIHKQSIEIIDLLDKLKNEGNAIVGYGVPAKFATLFHVLGLKSEFFDYLVDDNPLKHGNYGPGTALLIKPAEELLKNIPDYVFLFSWNYSEQISDKIFENQLVSKGIITPLPDLSIKLR
jgi:2-polyprenyl-3-methyl-5-hydroxy-6-metoxy-1,4-benzoquinol methylase